MGVITLHCYFYFKNPVKKTLFLLTGIFPHKICKGGFSNLFRDGAVILYRNHGLFLLNIGCEDLQCFATGISSQIIQQLMLHKFVTVFCNKHGKNC